MTYEEAVTVLRRKRDEGLRDVHDAELFGAYETGLVANKRIAGPLYVKPDVRHLLFKDMRVWER